MIVQKTSLIDVSNNFHLNDPQPQVLISGLVAIYPITQNV